ncbi:MAG: hypothetical protein ACM4D3_11335 [Candidatus Sericytochromatia bacterium]
MRRWFLGLIAVMILVAAFVAPPATAGDAPIGRLGDTLRIQAGELSADVTVSSVLPSDIPPGFGYPPRWPRSQLYRAQVTVRPVDVPTPYALASRLSFRGLTQTGDQYEPRETDAPDALQYALLNAPAGATVSGGVWWDCYRDLVTNVVLIDPKTGFPLAQWNI